MTPVPRSEPPLWATPADVVFAAVSITFWRTHSPNVHPSRPSPCGPNREVRLLCWKLQCAAPFEAGASHATVSVPFSALMIFSIDSRVDPPQNVVPWMHEQLNASHVQVDAPVDGADCAQSVARQENCSTPEWTRVAKRVLGAPKLVALGIGVRLGLRLRMMFR
jgi:hypothetical protein